MKWLLQTLLTLGLALGLPASAVAHKSSDAYLQMTRAPDGLLLRVDVALRDLDAPLELDTDANAELTFAEVKAAWPAIERYVSDGLRIAGCALRIDAQGLERRSDGAYAVLWYASSCRPAAAPALHYTLLREVDSTHRGLLSVQWGDAAPQVQVLDPLRPVQADARPASGAVPEVSAASFFGEGIHHIVTGYDHVLFLLCLLLPAVMRRGPKGWTPVQTWAQALWPVLGIVTAFTVAHSITLGLATLRFVALPPSVIEPAIAATIVLAALDNLRPVFHGYRLPVTFCFGLVHGFGFAGVLGELDLPSAQFAWALLQFNLGLEFGQIVIVALAAGALFALRARPGYANWAIRAGSFAALAVGVSWFVQRTADVALFAGV